MKTQKTVTLPLLLMVFIVVSCATPARSILVDAATSIPILTTAPRETPPVAPTATVLMRPSPTPIIPAATAPATSRPTLVPRTPAPTWNGVIVTVVPDVVATSPALDVDGGYYDYGAALEIVRLTNEFRLLNGKKPLAIDERLMDIARKRAKEIIGDFSHTGIDKFCNCGENIVGWGTSSPNFLVDQWIASHGHRENMLVDQYARIGVGVYKTLVGVYAVQNFE